jgi:hypothetical protein
VNALSVADRLYAERFDRAPPEEPWRSQWCRIEAQHAAALRVGDATALGIACALADERYRIECEWREDWVRRQVAGLMGHE